MPKTPITPSKTDRALAKQIVSESSGVKVTFGRTNGQVVFHANGFTLKDAADWEKCPLNNTFKRNERARGESSKTTVAREQEINSLNESIANRDAV